MACGEPHMTFKFSDRACGFFSRVQKTAYALQWGFRVLCPLRFHPGVGGDSAYERGRDARQKF